MKRNVNHTYIEAVIDYGIIAKSIYKILKEEETHGNETNATEDKELHGLQGA